jgi:hypothetical protein
VVLTGNLLARTEENHENHTKTHGTLVVRTVYLTLTSEALPLHQSARFNELRGFIFCMGFFISMVIPKRIAELVTEYYRWKQDTINEISNGN